MKLLSGVLVLAFSASVAHAECLAAIRRHDEAASEVDRSARRIEALKDCAKEVAQDPARKKTAGELVGRCRKSLGEIKGAGDSGPHRVESCELDAYRFALWFGAP